MLRKAYYVVCTVLLVTLPANNAVSVAQHVEPAVKTPPRVYTSVTDPTSTFLSSLPASYMLLAERHISAGDFEAAEYEVRKIISVLEIESESSNEEPNELLRAATDSLYSIRETLAEDSTVPTKRLRTTFAKAHCALASHHLSTANSVMEENPALAAHCLEYVGLLMEQATRLSDSDLPQMTVTAITNARGLANQLIVEEVEDRAAAEAKISNLRRELRTLIKKVDSNTATRPKDSDDDFRDDDIK